MLSDLKNAISVRPMVGSETKANRLFRYATARGRTPRRASIRRNTAIVAEHSIVFSVAYTSYPANSTGHERAINPYSGENEEKRARRAARISSAQRTGTYLYSSWRSRPAAFAFGGLFGAASCAECYAEEVKATRRRGSAPLDAERRRALKIAIYARYSSDSQRDASIADQFRMCRLHAEKQGWTIVEEYSDHAVSGSSMIQRAGIRR